MMRQELHEGARAVPWAAMAGVTAAVAVFAISQGLTYPLLSFILQRQGVSPSLIGLSAAMTPLGIIASSPVIPWLARRFGPGRTAVACAGLSALTLVLIALVQDVWLWFPLRFLLGVVTNPLYVLSEIWMIAITPAERRGRLMGVYTAVISMGFAAGPASLTLVGSEGWAPFAVGIISFIGSGCCLLAVLHRLPPLYGEGETASVLGFLPLAWLLMFAVVVAAGFEQTILALLPVYGLDHGIGERAMSGLLTVMIAGNLILPLMGLLAERLSARAVLVACAVVTALGCALLPWIIATPLIWPIAFLWGAVSFGIYTMALIQLGDRFSGAMMVAGNAAFALMWGLGGIVLPPISGAAMDVFGPQGLPAFVGVVCLVLAIAAGLSKPHRAKP
jgi:MFS family permease